MAHNFYHDRYKNSGMNVLGALFVGAMVGAAAVFLSDEKNRRRLQVTAEDWKKKADKAKDEIEEKAEDLRQKGLARVKEELARSQKAVDRKMT